MKKTLTAALLTCCCAYSLESPYSMHTSKPKYHRLYVGPDISIFHMKEKSFNTNPFDGELNSTSIKFNSAFEGLRIGYDYLQPGAVYFGTYGLIGNRENILKVSGLKPSKSSSLCANFEGRIGYNFQSLLLASSMLTPFIGIGLDYEKPYTSSASKTFWTTTYEYAVVGFRMIQQFYDRFDIGLNFKTMYTFAGRYCQILWMEAGAFPSISCFFKPLFLGSFLLPHL